MLLWALALSLLALAASFQIPERDYDSRQYFVVELDARHSHDAFDEFVAQYNLTFKYEHPVRGLDDHYVFSLLKSHPYIRFLGNLNSNNYKLIKRAAGLEEPYDHLVSSPTVRLIHMLEPKQLERRLPIRIDDSDPSCSKHKRLEAVDSSQILAKEVSDKLDIKDPLFFEQWHLVNTFFPGHDVNVKNVWYEGIRGKNVTVAVVDDGLDYESADLADNFNANGLWDFNNNGHLPTPRLFDDYHGTRCAGEVAGVKNDVCGIGVAYEAKVAGIRILSGRITSEEEAAAMIYGMEYNDIYSCSWGPTDNGETVGAPDKIVKKAIVKGVQKGRNGKGSIYVFASGNGGRVGDQCNFDGYTNSIYSITIGAIDYKGLHPDYAETCSAVMVVTYSSGSGEHIHTTDFHLKCTALHGGTSAAAPLAAGLFALALQANPDLTWRDLQHVCAKSAVPVHEEDGEYQETLSGQKYSHKYGFGKIDAEKLVEVAKTWKNVKPQAWYYSDVITVDKKASAGAENNSETITSSWQVTKEHLKYMNLEKVEHVTVTVNIDSGFRGKIDVKLISPTGVVSKLAWFRKHDSSEKGLSDWTFMSVAHFGEDGLGEWRIEAFTGLDNEIHFKNWQMRLFGACIDPAKAEEFDLDKDYASSWKLLGESVSSSDKATVNTEPTSTGESTRSDAAQSTKPSGPTGTPEQSSGSLIKGPTATPTATPGEGANKGHFISVGHYIMALMVLGFICVIATMKWPMSQSSSRRRRGEYEFDVIPGEEYSDSEDEVETFELTPSQEELEQERLYMDPDHSGVDYDNDIFQIEEEEADDDKHAPSGFAPEDGQTDQSDLKEDN